MDTGSTLHSYNCTQFRITCLLRKLTLKVKTFAEFKIMISPRSILNMGPVIQSFTVILSTLKIVCTINFLSTDQRTARPMKQHQWADFVYRHITKTEIYTTSIHQFLAAKDTFNIITSLLLTPDLRVMD